jgi:hypothetical protein
LETTASAGVGLTLIAAGHTGGWPILRGGAQSLTDALVRHLEDLGGRVETGREVTELPLSDLVLADITPRQLLRIAGSHLSTDYRKQLERFRYGPGAFKIDYALNAAIPGTARECPPATVSPYTVVVSHLAFGTLSLRSIDAPGWRRSWNVWISCSQDGPQGSQHLIRVLSAISLWHKAIRGAISYGLTPR